MIELMLVWIALIIYFAVSLYRRSKIVDVAEWEYETIGTPFEPEVEDDEYLSSEEAAKYDAVRAEIDAELPALIERHDAR